MSEQAGSPSRRLTEAEAALGAELFAAGKSEREVSEALGCSASTAHRLRERLQAAQDGPELTGRAPLPDGLPVLHMRLNAGGGVDLVDPAEGLADEVEDSMRADQLGQLRTARDEEARAVSDHEDRAGALRQAIAADEAEWAEGARTGRAAQELRELRQRIRDAADDLAAKELAIGTGRQLLAKAEAQIAEAQAAIAAIAAERTRQEAVRLGARLAPKAAAALRTAVTGDGTVRALADLASQLAQAEAVTGRSWDSDVIPPALPGNARDEWHRAVCDLWRSARTGDAAACQRVIPRCLPWQDRDPGEIAQMAAEVVKRQNEMNQMAMTNQARLRQHSQGGQPMLQELPNALPGAVRSARTGW